jgi:N-acetylmuramoyl-L-alanine amidase
MLKEELEALGAEIVMTREVNEITISGLERVEIGNSSGADFVIRIHADGSTDPSVHGVSTFVPAGDLMGHPEIKDESVRLGQLMVDCVAEKTGAKNLGAIPRSDLQGHNWSQIPSVFIEMGYMTNAQDDALLETEEYQLLIVEGMVESILLWYQ